LLDGRFTIAGNVEGVSASDGSPCSVCWTKGIVLNSYLQAGSMDKAVMAEKFIVVGSSLSLF
jgi:hypothetical protein